MTATCGQETGVETVIASPAKIGLDGGAGPGDWAAESNPEAGPLTERPVEFKPLSLSRNTTWNAFGLAVTAICQWAVLIVLAKLGKPEMIGQYTLGLAVTAPIMLFANLQLRAVQVLDVQRSYSFGDLLTLRLMTTTAALAVIAVISFSGGYRWETACVVLAVGLVKALDSASELVQGLYQQSERMDWVAWSQILKSVLGLGALALTVALTGGILGGTLAMACLLGACVVLYDLPTAARLLASRGADGLKPRWNPPVLLRITRRALPYGIVIMLVSLTFNIPRYTIQRVHGEAALGIFSALAYVLVVAATLNSALGQAAFPRLARDHAAGDWRAFYGLLAKLVMLGLIAGVLGIVAALAAGEWILSLVYGQEFARHGSTLVVIMIVAGMMAVASPLNYGMVAAGYRKTLLPLYGTVVIGAELASRLLIPNSGPTGWALAFLATYSIQVVASLGVLAHDALRSHRRRGPRIGLVDIGGSPLPGN